MPSVIGFQMTAILSKRKQHIVQLSKETQELVDCTAKQSLFPLQEFRVISQN